MDDVKARCVLFAECHPPTIPEVVDEILPPVAEELRDTSYRVISLKHPSLEELRKKVEEAQPEMVYCTGSYAPYRDLLNAQQSTLSFPDTNAQPSSSTIDLGFLFQTHRPMTLYIDAPISGIQVEGLRHMGCTNLVYWPSEGQTCAAVAAQFSGCFFAAMRNPSVTFSEAFALATRSVQLLCDHFLKEMSEIQLLPSCISPHQLELPQCSSVPLDPIPDIRFFDDDVPDVEGWENVLLLAPKAEVRLLICGGPSTIDAIRLSYLGEALRALLLTEMRSLIVMDVIGCDHVPPNIAPGSSAVRCTIRCSSGIETVVVLGGPPIVLANKLLVQHALRQTLAVDSLCLQFRLPPPSLPPTIARSSAAVAGGTPVVDALVVTSVWAVHILRGLCQDRSYRGLASLGIAGVGGTSIVHFKFSDTIKYNAIVTGTQHQPLVPAGGQETESRTVVPRSRDESRANVDMDVDCVDSLDNISDDMELDPEYEASSKTSNEMSFQMPSITPTDYHSTRPPLSRCTEVEFYDDLVAFLEAHRGKPLDRERFPEAVLNGCQLDLFNLYKEVVSRGGFRVGNGINWKGQVFPKMRNWTANHKMTGVGNALKRHYQSFLREYEMVQSEIQITDERSQIGFAAITVRDGFILHVIDVTWVPSRNMQQEMEDGSITVLNAQTYSNRLKQLSTANKDH